MQSPRAPTTITANFLKYISEIHTSVVSMLQKASVPKNGDAGFYTGEEIKAEKFKDEMSSGDEKGNNSRGQRAG